MNTCRGFAVYRVVYVTEALHQLHGHIIITISLLLFSILQIMNWTVFQMPSSIFVSPLGIKKIN